MKKKVNKLTAVIDIGAHSIRLFIGYIVRIGVFKEVERLWVPIPLGMDTFSTGVISNQTIQNVINIIKKFKEMMDSYQIENYRALATSSVREAMNSDIFVERVYHATGIFIEIIEPMQETRILYNGVKKLMKDRYGFLTDRILMFSIGGGTTQLVLQSAGKVHFSETHSQGTLRLRKNFELLDKHLRYSLMPLAYNFTQTIKRYCDIERIDRLVVLNDDILSLIKKTMEDSGHHDVFRITKKKFNSLLQNLENLDEEKLKDQYSLNDQVVETTKVAMMMVSIFFDLTGAKDILLPDITMSQAVLNELTYKEMDLLHLDESAIDNIHSSTLGIGRKYQFDEKHAVQVNRIALSIYDQLEQQLGFRPEERVLLDVSSMLHDIGAFVSSSNHHKHSQRLISASEILGLNRSEIQLIALIARYHRKAIPKPSHTEYISLPRDERITVARMGAILRVADALDNTHTQWVESLKVDWQTDRCLILINIEDEGMEYMDILVNAVKSKGDLFESFFGVPVSIERLL